MDPFGRFLMAIVAIVAVGAVSVVRKLGLERGIRG
jgi:hypothetical protein